MDYEFLKIDEDETKGYERMKTKIERIAHGKEIDRKSLGEGTSLYVVKGFLGTRVHVELEQVTVGRDEWKKEGVYIQIHAPGKIPRNIRKILAKEGYQNYPERRN